MVIVRFRKIVVGVLLPHLAFRVTRSQLPKHLDPQYQGIVEPECLDA
jgi:hypothetical protein